MTEVMFDEMRLLVVTYPRFVDLICGTGFIDYVELPVKRAHGALLPT